MLPFYSDDAVTIWHGNALDLPLDDASVDLICTSPPYFGLRAYSDGGETYGGQIGSEATPGEFLDALAAATAEMARVLKPSGSLWVNLGDKYAGKGNLKTSHNNNGALGKQGSDGGLQKIARTASHVTGFDGIPDKSLMLVPERYRIRCVDDLGLIARAVIVWDKPNGLPESVRDRVRRSHEDWVHLTKGAPLLHRHRRDPRAAQPADRPAQSVGAHVKRRRRRREQEQLRPVRDLRDEPPREAPGVGVDDPHPTPPRPPPELGIDHFAAFPMEWPRRIIRGWSPTGICVECGEGRRPIAAKKAFSSQGSYACACATPTAPTRPAVVLDPFGGTGTTGVVAKALGRRAHLVDLSRDYCRLAQWRVNDPKELAKAGQVKAAKKAKVAKMRRAAEPEQGSLLDDPAA